MELIQEIIVVCSVLYIFLFRLLDLHLRIKTNAAAKDQLEDENANEGDCVFVKRHVRIHIAIAVLVYRSIICIL